MSAATDHPFVLVGFEPDWEALYIDGHKETEGHHVDKGDLVTYGQSLAVLTTGATPRLETTHVEDDEADEHGEHIIPDTLEELAETAPLAYGRISA